MDRNSGRHRVKRRRRRHNRKFLSIRRISLWALAIGFLVIGAGQAIGNNLPMVLVKISEEQQIQQEPFLPNDMPESLPKEETPWNLILVNPWNPLPADYPVTLTQLKNGHAVDERCYEDLQNMMDDCRAAGLSPVICSSYRSREKQENLFQNQVNGFLAKGFTKADAWAEAGKAVAVPGTSEHQLGLAVDIVDLSNQNLDKSQENTAVQKWLMENSWRYGFILRYPNEKSDITGIIYEPWHYRYVGKEAAEEIYQSGICLEEYVEQLALGPLGA